MSSTPPATAEAIDPAPPDETLKRNALGTAGIVFLVVSAAAPLSVAAAVGPLAILIGGVSAPVVYLLAGVVLLVFAVGFMAMTRYVTALGGFYTYVTASLGRVVGLGSRSSRSCRTTRCRSGSTASWACRPPACCRRCSG